MIFLYYFTLLINTADFNRPFPSYLKPLFQSHSLSYQNEFNLHVNEISFSYERMSTKTRFEKEAKGNSEMAYCSVAFTS